MKFEKFVLNNGIRIILAPLKNTEAVTVHVGIKVGSCNETKDINGISHFLEHMMFKGTKKRPSTLAIAEELDQIGGEYNAYTHKEFTVYYVKVLYNHLNLALDIISDMLLNSLFEQKEIDRERGVIIEEINLYQDTPARYIGDLFEKALWGDSFLGREIIGSKENILKFTRENFLNHIKNFYYGENIVVTISGKFDKDVALKLVKKYFNSFTKKTNLEQKNKNDVNNNKRFLFLAKNTDQTHLAVGFRSYSLLDQKKYAMNLLAIILGGNMSSRFFINIRERLGLCYYISSDVEHYLDDGYFVTFSGVKNENLGLAIEKIIEGYQEINNKEISKEEIKKAKDYLKGKTLLHLEESQAVAEFLGRQEILLKKILTYQEIFEIIESLNAKSLQRIWQDVFSFKNLKIACIGPAKNQKVVSNLGNKLIDDRQN